MWLVNKGLPFIILWKSPKISLGILFIVVDGAFDYTNTKYKNYLHYHLLKSYKLSDFHLIVLRWSL